MLLLLFFIPTVLLLQQKAAELQEAMRVQANLQRADSDQQQDPGSPRSGDDGVHAKRVAPEDKLMAAVGARRREWQMVYSHLYMKVRVQC
jgi:hypothetical protein